MRSTRGCLPRGAPSSCAAAARSQTPVRLPVSTGLIARAACPYDARLRLSHEIEIERPPDEVYAYLADPTHLHEWQADVHGVEVESETRFRESRTLLGREATSTVDVLRAEPARELTLRASGGPATVTVRHVLEPAGAGADATHRHGRRGGQRRAQARRQADAARGGAPAQGRLRAPQTDPRGVAFPDMSGPDQSDAPRPLRLAELLASISLATDLGTGQPVGHALRTCAIATALAEALGCGPDELRTVHQFALLRFLGCTADAAETAALAGGDDRAFNAAMAPVLMGSSRELLGGFVRAVAADQPPARRLGPLARAVPELRHGQRSLATHCEVAVMLAGRAGLERPVVEALAHAYERWDGKGAPAGLAGEAIPLAVRVVVVARDADLATLLGLDVGTWLSERRGRAYDPAVVDALDRVGPDALAGVDGGDEWTAALAAEPEPATTIGPDDLDPLLAACADFTDLKSPWSRGHSRRVAALAEEAGRRAGLDEPTCDGLRRAGLLHDLGRVAVENGIWDKPGPLTTSEWERVRLHSYYTERILARCEPLAALVQLAAAHHERLDGVRLPPLARRHGAVSPGQAPGGRGCLRGARRRPAAPARLLGGRRRSSARR